MGHMRNQIDRKEKAPKELRDENRRLRSGLQQSKFNGQRAVERARTITSTPTDAQLHHLAELANRLHRPLPQPKTYEEATRWIDQLKTERDTR